jgi:cephalosporin-C deacetylase
MPLTFDLPFEELQTYLGISPCPADFNEFWDKSILEMQSLDPQIELQPANFQSSVADCFHLWFSGCGGARIHAKLLRPRNAPTPHPAVLLFHGYTADSGPWSEKLSYVSQGFTVAALDCRGQGGLSQDVGGTNGNTHRGHFIRGLDDALSGHPQKLLFRQIFLDTAQLAKIVMQMPEVDPARVGAAGGSQGGALTVACAALESRIKRAAPAFPFLSDYKRVWDIDMAVDAYAELKEYFRHFDPRHTREHEIFEKLGYIDIQFLAPRVKADVRWSTSLMDTICPPSSQFAAYNKLTCRKSIDIYPDFGHERLPEYDDRTFEFLTGL